MTDTRDDEQTPTHDTGRRYMVIGLSIAAVIVVAIFGVGVWLHGRNDNPPPAPTATPTSTTTGTASTSTQTPEQQASAAAEKAYREYIHTLDGIRASGGKTLGNLNTIAVNEARLAGLNTAKSYASKGIRAVGTTQVTSVQVTSSHLDVTPPAVVLRTCVDSSGTSVVDRSGKTKPAAIALVGDEVTVLRTASGNWVVANVLDKAVGSCG